jgi:hypothetical protein
MATNLSQPNSTMSCHSIELMWKQGRIGAESVSNCSGILQDLSKQNLHEVYNNTAVVSFATSHTWNI